MITITTTSTREIRHICKHKENGYIAKKQDSSSIYLTYTNEVSEAKTYASKFLAARAHNFRSENSDIAKSTLQFVEVVINTRTEYNYEKT